MGKSGRWSKKETTSDVPERTTARRFGLSSGAGGTSATSRRALSHALDPLADRARVQGMHWR